MKTEISKLEAIIALKKKFPGNNPASWSKTSLKQLKEWYKEYILEDLTVEIKIS